MSDYTLSKPVAIKHLEDMEFYVTVSKGEIIKLAHSDSFRDFTALIEVSEIYNELEESLIKILEDGDESFWFDY
jgi:hypothetical protein